MTIHHDIENLPAISNGVITFGSFDGVHLGHAELIGQMQKMARSIDGVTVIVTFDPHPRQVIYPNDASLRLLSTKEEKILLFERLGIDHLVICPFSVEFSQMLADEYITEFISKKFNPRMIVIGYDHRFGLNRAGNINFLRSYEASCGFEVVEIEQQVVEQIKISSTQIRSYLQEGDISTANKLLGHPYLLRGKVVRGDQIGEQLGYPTANIEINHPLKLVPSEGIYASRILVDDRSYQGMLYIGTRPTLDAKGKRSIEVHIFDFDEDIYDRQITLEILKFIRADETFDDLHQLRQQLDRDQQEVLTYLNGVESNTQQKAAVVILNYNGLAHLQRHLPSVVRFTPYRIVVADNSSTDQSLPWLRSHYPDIEIVELSENLGFAEGYNQALAQIDSEFLILINSDVEVTNGWTKPLLALMERNPEVGICQPKIKSYDSKGTFEYAGAAGGLMDYLGYPFCQGRILSNVEEDLGQYDQSKEVFWCSGAALIVRKETFEKFEGFDADFFAHMEEIDLCWRLKQAGYQMLYTPKSVVYHKGGGTLSYQSPRKTYLNFRNGLSLLVKNEKGLKLLWLLPLRVVLDLVACLRFFVVGEGRNGVAVIKALLYNLIYLPHIVSKRYQMRALIKRYRMGPDNTKTGRYLGSIVWEFFVLGKKKYADLRRVVSNRM